MKSQKQKIHSYPALMRYAGMLGFGDIHTKIDKKSGLHAIIAIHNTKLGPSLGGCRFYRYASPELALKDVIRLSYGMTFKSAISGVPHGGAKSVIIEPNHPYDRKALFRAFGDFIQELNGRYITAVDVGSNLEDMTTILERTPFVIGAAGPGRVDQDPSPSTARGVFRAMQAAIKFQYNRDNFEGMRVAIQGMGRVGYGIAVQLKEHGATLIVADKNPDVAKQAADKLGATLVSPAEIENVPCDIFSPCALGGTITLEFIQKTHAKIICGAANNQLAHHNNGYVMQERGITYLPDFLVNSGGLINAAMTYAYQDLSMVNSRVDHIYDTMMVILERAKKSGKPPERIAEDMALERLRA